jgi:hypothetical protein
MKTPWTKNKDELIHALDHVLSDLDMKPWDEYVKDPKLMKVMIEDAVEQIEYIQKAIDNQWDDIY